MIAIDPDEIVVEDAGSDFELRGKNRMAEAEIEKLKGLVNIHQKWGMTIPEVGGTAYIRITPQLRDFFLLCQKTNGVIGFEYDFNEGGLNFGLVLKKDDAKTD